MKFNAIDNSDIILIKRIGLYVKAYKLKLFLALLCILFGTIVGLTQPILWGRILANLFNKNFNVVSINILYITIIYILQALVSFLQSYLTIYIINNLAYDIKCDMYRKILDLPINAFDDMRVGDFIS